MTHNYTVVEDLAGLIESITPESIVSRTFYKEGQMKAILFGFDTGEVLSEHTSSQAAILQIIEGEATVTLGDETYEAQSGFWVYMPPHLKHSIHAKTPLKMLLLMLSGS
jgi:quercetin dioxygenase-like cupin family protein